MAGGQQATKGEKRGSISFSTDPIKVKIISEPYVILTQRGYAPVVDIEAEEKPEASMMYISASSLSQALEGFRSENDMKFSGISIKIRKESSDRFAKYVVEPA